MGIFWDQINKKSMKIFKSSILSGLSYLFILTMFCAAPENEENTGKWISIIKDLEIILASEIPDSAKALKIKILFDTNQISLSDYQKFYEKSIDKDPLKNLDYLKRIEKLISEDMKTVARLQREKIRDIDYRSGQQEKFKK